MLAHERPKGGLCLAAFNPFNHDCCLWRRRVEERLAIGMLDVLHGAIALV